MNNHRLEHLPNKPSESAPGVTGVSIGARLRAQDERRKKALKLLEAITEDCDVRTDGDHIWRKCRACLARFELDGAGPRALLRELLQSSGEAVLGEANIGARLRELRGAIDLFDDLAEVLRDLAAGTTPDTMKVTTPTSLETLADDCEQYSQRLETLVAALGVGEPPQPTNEADSQALSDTPTVELFRRLEHDYGFECEGGPLRHCVEWLALRQRLGVGQPPTPRPIAPPAEEEA